MTLADVYKKIVTFLNKGRYKYIIIGGIAASMIGEQRFTHDVDVDIYLSKDDVPDFLKKAANAGFKVLEEKCLESVEQTGIFQISYGDYHIDFIIASTDLETQAYQRRIAIQMQGVKAFFPTPEDLILLKIIPGRDKDLLDAKNIVLRHKGKLDKRYLKRWAEKLCDEAQDMRISNVLKSIIRD